MQIFLKMFGLSTAVLGLVVTGAFDANAAATGRAAYDTVRATSSTSTARMPTMPTLPINSVGNLSPNVPTTPTPNPKPDVPTPDPKPDPEPTPECPDGGVKNSDYTITNCMNDVLSCVNRGALPNGLNDLFNEDLRNAIMNGMNLCAVQVEKCITTVRRDCENVYRTTADVWLDFNSRVIQPEYYNFVLRKTGLTPNQAENTCWLLDKNTYGTSFSAVANDGTVTAEYNNKVGAYNSQQGNVLVKNNPQGVRVNNGNSGVDGQRGHYARWDATKAECWVRVAAYNKDEQIKNSWLFGAAGDDKMAEVWKLAGDTFTCNKDLFGFSLLNDTSTAAVVGVGGGTLVGAGVGAIAGHGARNFDCTNNGQVKKLAEQLTQSGNIGILNEFMERENRVMPNAKNLTRAQCQEIVNLYSVHKQLNTALDDCRDVSEYTQENQLTVRIRYMASDAEAASVAQDIIDSSFPQCRGKSLDACMQVLTNACAMHADDCISYLQSSGYVGADASAKFDINVTTKSKIVGKCAFRPINIAKINGELIYCNPTENGCQTATDIRTDVDRLGRALSGLDILAGEKSNMAKSVGIGAATGAGAGGLATAITAFVERSNISCHVGDGLDKVGFGKSYSIGTLKDFYVKWNLRLPDTIMPTANVTNCETWKAACATLTDLNQCAAAQVNYKPADANTITLVNSACTPSGSVCIENHAVAVSQGACK